MQQQNPPRFPFEQRTRAGLLLFMGTLRLYTKQALSISEQIELLKSRGLNIADSFKAVQRLETALRTKIIQEFSLAHGPFWFFDTSLADDEHKSIENMNSIDRELQRCKEDFIKEHRRNYDKPIFPPAWKTLELHLLVRFQNSITISVTRS